MKPVRPGPWDPDDDELAGEQRLRRRSARPHVEQNTTAMRGMWAGGGCPAVPHKRRYPTKAAARAAIRAQSDGQGLSAYSCASCGGAHAGHLPAAVRRGLATRDDIVHAPPLMRPNL